MTFIRRHMLSRGGRVAFLSAILSGTLVMSALAQTATPRPTLYHRLGGYDGIASYIALVFPRVAQHPELSRMFGGHGKDSQQKQHALHVSAGTMALPLTLHSCSLAWRNIRSFLVCSADMGRTASRSSSNWSSS